MGHLGLDPEYFAVNPETGLALSAHHFIGDETLQMYEVTELKKMYAQLAKSDD